MGDIPPLRLLFQAFIILLIKPENVNLLSRQFNRHRREVSFQTLILILTLLKMIFESSSLEVIPHDFIVDSYHQKKYLYYFQTFFTEPDLHPLHRLCISKKL